MFRIVRKNYRCSFVPRTLNTRTSRPRPNFPRTYSHRTRLSLLLAPYSPLTPNSYFAYSVYETARYYTQFKTKRFNHVPFSVTGIAESDVFGFEQQFHTFHQPGRFRQPTVPESSASPEQSTDVGFDCSPPGLAVADRVRPQLQPADGPTGSQHVAQVAEFTGHVAGTQSAQQRPARIVRRPRANRVVNA